MTSKISMLQRQQAFQAAAINNEHKLVKVCKDQIKWLKSVPDIACTQKRIDVLYRCIDASRKRIAKLVEMQKFTKGQLFQAYKMDSLQRRFLKYNRDEHISKPVEGDYKHNPEFMAEAPAATVEIFIEGLP